MDKILTELIFLVFIIISCVAIGLESLIMVFVALPILFMVIKAFNYMRLMIRW
jgi:hypothetical protein